MKIIENNTNLVIAGSWNPGIINPNWLNKNFPKFVRKKDIQVELALNSNDIRYKVDDISIILNPQKLNIIALEESVECYKRIEKFSKELCDILHHTPIYGIGHNVKYQLEQEKLKIESNESSLYNNNKTFKSFNMYSQQIKHSLTSKTHNINITYEYLKDVQTVYFNFHYNIVNNENVQSFLSDFLNNINISDKMIKELVE